MLVQAHAVPTLGGQERVSPLPSSPLVSREAIANIVEKGRVAESRIRSESAAERRDRVAEYRRSRHIRESANRAISVTGEGTLTAQVSYKDPMRDYAHLQTEIPVPVAGDILAAAGLTSASMDGLIDPEIRDAIRASKIEERDLTLDQYGDYAGTKVDQFS